MSKPLAIWTTGAPVPAAERARGSFFEMIATGVRLGFEGNLVAVACSPQGMSRKVPSQALGDLDAARLCDVAGIVVSGSPARLGTREPWMDACLSALRTAHARRVPILGICFGHQLLGEALGGAVGPNPQGREIGTVPLQRAEEDPLLDGIQAPPNVVMTHLDSVLRAPSDATVVATTQMEPHAALRFSETTWGVQFHPEMDAEVIGHYVEARRDAIEQEGLLPDEILSGRMDSRYGTQLLQRFGQLCQR